MPSINSFSPNKNSPKKKAKKQQQRQQNGLTQVYLVIYNLVSAAAWAFLGYQVIEQLANQGNHHMIFNKTIDTLKYVQLMAVLEVVHAALGLVPSAVTSTAMQISSRLFISWYAGATLKAGVFCQAYPMMLGAWILSDLTRYLYYTANLLSLQSSILTWLRYSLFLALYPIGTIGEMLMILTGRHATSGNISHGLLAISMVYPLGFMYMYSHMIKQRRKYLSQPKAKSS